MMSSFFPKEIFNFLFEIEKLGFSLCLVGGASRSYILNQAIDSDLDFEIRASIKIPDNEWENYYQSLFKFLDEKNIKYTRLPYLITRIRFQGHDIEVSSPRIEKFNFENENNSHHGFDAILSSSLTFEESFIRRDFRVNAIGILFNFNLNSSEVIDPFNGVDDLKQKKLNILSEDFFKDPVRFVRMLRFSINLNFEIPRSVLDNLCQFQLSQLTVYYFVNELFKCNTNGDYLDSFRKLVIDNKIQISKEFEVWKNLNCSFKNNHFKTKESLIVFLFLSKEEKLEEFILFFGMKKKTHDEIQKYYESYLLLLKLNKEEARKITSQGNLVFKNSLEYLSLIRLDELHIWKIYFNEHGQLNRPLPFIYTEWKNFQIDQKEIMSLDANERASYKLFRALEEWCREL